MASRFGAQDVQGHGQLGINIANLKRSPCLMHEYILAYFAGSVDARKLQVWPYM